MRCGELMSKKPQILIMRSTDTFKKLHDRAAKLVEDGYKKRTEAVKLADAIIAIENTTIETFAKELSARWARGEITGSEMKTLLIEKHKQEGI